MRITYALHRFKDWGNSRNRTQYNRGTSSFCLLFSGAVRPQTIIGLIIVTNGLCNVCECNTESQQLLLAVRLVICILRNLCSCETTISLLWAGLSTGFPKHRMTPTGLCSKQIIVWMWLTVTVTASDNEPEDLTVCKSIRKRRQFVLIGMVKQRYIQYLQYNEYWSK